jgi:hypothetical protein
MIPRNSLIGEELRSFTRAGVEYVIFNQLGGGNPYWQNPPAIPESIILSISNLEREIETVASMREVSFARLPKYASRASAQLFRGLKEQDEIVLTPQLDEVDANLSEAHKFRLQLIQERYNVKRLIKTVGKNKQTLVEAFRGEELRDNTDVRIRSGVDLFSQRQQKEEIVMGFIEKGLITDPRKALELLDRKDMQQFMEEEFIDERHAERENEMMRRGKVYPAVDENDNHAVHYERHNNERKKEEFRTWDKKSQEWLMTHMDRHKELLNMEKGEAESAPQEDQAQAPATPPAVEMRPEDLLAELIAQQQSQGGT